jgi:hypothetical protein
MQRAGSEAGLLLPAAIFMVAVMAVLLVALAYLNTAGLGSSVSHSQSSQALFAAESGIEVAISQFSRSPPAPWCTGLVSVANTNVAVGSGTFTITSATVYPSGAVASSLSGSGIATTSPGVITVTSVANFAPHGRIRIESEEIDYSHVSNSATVCGTAPCFVAWRRGANATTAAVHAAGSAVFQDSQCLIRVTGQVDTSKRILEAMVR